jgi:hypothetical protein
MSLSSSSQAARAAQIAQSQAQSQAHAAALAAASSISSELHSYSQHSRSNSITNSRNNLVTSMAYNSKVMSNNSNQRRMSHTPKVSQRKPPSSSPTINQNQHFQNPVANSNVDLSGMNIPLPNQSIKPLSSSSNGFQSDSQPSTNKNVWNDINQSSSTTALAAAASIAKNKPTSLISNSTSPKLVKSSTLPVQRQTTLSLRPNDSTTKLPRKPPPPPRQISLENVLPKKEVASIFKDEQTDSFGIKKTMSHSHSQSSINEINNSNTDNLYNKKMTKSEKLSNFFISKNQTDDEGYNNHQYSTSTSMVSSHSLNNELNISLSNDSQSKVNSHPSLHRSVDDGDENSFKLNSSQTQSSYQQPSMSTQQLVFKTTLRKNNDRKLGFGRNKKNKAEFNEDKPWKNHDHGYLNIIKSEEKKRYEGVFAANKSVYLDLDLNLTNNSKKTGKSLSKFVNAYTNIDQRIHGIIVSEIWLRSKLDNDTLSKIWYLVLDDRKRRWIKLIMNGDEEWLVDEVDQLSLLDMELNENESDYHYSEVEETGNDLDNFNDQINDNSFNNTDDCLEINDIDDEKINQFNESYREQSPSRSVIHEDTPKYPSRPRLESKSQRHSYEKRSSILDIDRSYFDDGTLTCDEFVVGMWIIDQCLYGRKLPKIIPLTVWETIGVDWTLSSGIYGQYAHSQSKSKLKSNHHHSHVPIVGDIVGMGIKTGIRTSKTTKRGVLKKVMGKNK